MSVGWRGRVYLWGVGDRLGCGCGQLDEASDVGCPKVGPEIAVVGGVASGGVAAARLIS